MILKVRCPTCGKWGEIEVSEDAIKSISHGLLAINVPEKIICSDSFILYIDKNLNIRDSFVADLNLELPNAVIEKSKEEELITFKKKLDIELIKLNIPPLLLAFILRGILFKQRIVLILDEDHLYDHINNLIEYITQNSFETEFSIIHKDIYDNNKKSYKKSLVLQGKEVLNDKNKIINPKKLPIERRIIQQFYGERQSELSLIMLMNEIQKASEFSHYIVDVFSNVEDKKYLDIAAINNKLQEKYKIKISSFYLKFLIDIVENYYKFEIPLSIKLVLKTVF